MQRTPVVTALREAGRGRIAIELDGSPWRVLPAESVLSAGLDTGILLDRERARRLRTELRRVEARGAALSALSRRDLSAATLRSRLAAKGIAPVDREAAVVTMKRAGLVDDQRFARERASALAARGAGDALIRDDLERRGIAGDLVGEAIASVELEFDRARKILAGQDRSPRALRRLMAKGFSEETLDGLIADQPETELG
jgi:regulatory protein